MKNFRSNIELDEYYLDLALALAAEGEGQVSPNPLVGAVMVKSEGLRGAKTSLSFGYAESGDMQSISKPHLQIKLKTYQRQVREQQYLY